MPLETSRLFLRKFAVSDAEEMYRNWASDPEVAKYLTWRAHGNLKITQDYLETICAHYHPDTYHWGIVHKRSGELIGSVGIVKTEGDTGIIGYALSRRYWNQGVMSEAAEEMLRFCFEQAGYQCIVGHFDVRNPASGRVMEKLGMTYVRTIPDGYVGNTGEPCTVHEYRIEKKAFELRGEHV